MEVFNKLKQIPLLIFSLLGIFFAGIFELIGVSSCQNIEVCYEFANIFRVFKYSEPLLFISLSILIFSIITIYVSNPVRGKWSKFTIIWVPLSLIFSLLIGGGSNGWIPTSPPWALVFSALTVIYLLISLGIVILKK